jgi:hypothetical protein
MIRTGWSGFGARFRRTAPVAVDRSSRPVKGARRRATGLIDIIRQYGYTGAILLPGAVP